MLLAVVVVVQVSNAVMLVLLPPPRSEVYRVEQIVQALRGDRSVEAMKGLKVGFQSRPPHLGSRTDSTHPRPMIDRMVVLTLADRLGVPLSHVRLEASRNLGGFLWRRELARGEGGPPPGERPGGFGDGGPEAFGRRGSPGPDGHGPRSAGPGGFGDGRQFTPPVLAPFKIGLLQPDGRWLVVESRQSFPSPWQQRVLLWLAVCASLCVPLAYAYARWLAAPIRRFAEAAERLGGDPSASELEISGPAEVRKAGEAFNRMQERLQRYIENRTTLVGAVAHDLRTPLARMRYLLETPVEDLHGRLGREIDEMDAMVGATMAFVRDSSAKAPRVDLDLASLLESLQDDAAEEGAAVSLTGAARAVIHADPSGMRRLFDNLVRNGLKFATEVTIDLKIEGDDAIVEVADNGPGLPVHDLERVFEPFYRGEASRNRETGGIGLGLAVVRSIARAHGGDATLANRPGGGLVCRVRLPLRPGR